MKLYLPELRLLLDEASLDDSPIELLRIRAARVLQIIPENIASLEIRRRSLDTRQRDAIWQVFGVEVEVDAGKVAEKERAAFGKLPKRALPAQAPSGPRQVPRLPMVVVGAGPAGLFCAQRLADNGVPVILLERGKPIRGRAQDTKIFRKGGPLNPESNIQFGEGGAGAYSDGKLTYRGDDPLSAWVLETFIRYGASPDIRVHSRPHIGTEHLRACIVRMTSAMAAQGVVFRHDTRLDGLTFSTQHEERRITGVRLADGEELPTEHVLLAIGHSARDTFMALHAQGVPFVAKAFAVGVRAEHPQTMVDASQYGRHAADNRLPRASYALSQKVNVNGERGVYSFCMCPGGETMACSSEEGGVVTNGMSYSVQRSGVASSGLVVAVTQADFGGTDADPFAGMRFQRDLEQAAFKLGGGNYHAPAQRIDDFLRGKTSGTIKVDGTTYHPGVREADLRSILPPIVTRSLQQSLPAFAKRIPDYHGHAGIIVGVETRTSSPVRIPRGEDLQAVGWKGLYPLGEGAGYAGGIVSAAVDGVKAADVILGRMG